MNRPKHISLRLLLVAIPLLMAMAPAMAQDTVYTGQIKNLSVVAIPGDTYVWELYNNVAGVNFATVPGNCPPAEAYFIGNASGPSVNVMWLNQGTYFYKVTAYRGGCRMNLKVGKMTVIWALLTAVIQPPPPICAGDSVHLAITFTGTAPWGITLTDGVNNFVFNNIMSASVTLTLPMIPAATTSYWILSATDAHYTDIIPSPPVVQVVNPLPVNSPIYHYGP